MTFIEWYHNYQDWIMLVCMFLALAIILTVFYVLSKKGMDVFFTRKGVHIAAGCYSLFWLMASDNSWSRWVGAIIPGLVAIIFLLIGLKVIPGKFMVDSMSRTGEPFDLIKGTLIYSLVMFLICVFIWKDQPWGLVTIMTIAWGDGIAPIAGRYFGTIRYKTLGKTRKTFEGSIAMFIFSVGFSFLVVYVFGLVHGQDWLMGDTWPWLWGKIMILCLVGTIAEGLSPTDIDNLVVPVVMLLLSMAFGLEWLNPLH